MTVLLVVFRTDSENGAPKEQSIECEQCCGGEEPAKAEWKCLNCRFPLCEKCKKQHLQIPILKGKLSYLVSLRKGELHLLLPGNLKVYVVSYMF